MKSSFIYILPIEIATADGVMHCGKVVALHFFQQVVVNIDQIFLLAIVQQLLDDLLPGGVG